MNCVCVYKALCVCVCQREVTNRKDVHTPTIKQKHIDIDLEMTCTNIHNNTGITATQKYLLYLTLHNALPTREQYIRRQINKRDNKC